MKYKKNNWKNSLLAVVAYANSQGWNIEILKQRGDIEVADLDSGSIILNGFRTPEIIFYYALHEVGHLLSHRKNPKRNYLKNKSSTQTYRVSMIEEEIRAWKKGKNLAKKLNLKINKKNFLRLKGHCLATYIRWFCTIKKNKTKNENKNQVIEKLKKD